MDSKKKFIKNRYWKRKYQPKNATTTIKTNKSSKNKNELIDQSDSDDEFELKQPIPKEGWFPDYNSSSSEYEDAESNVSSSISTTSSTQQIEKEKNWFDKELDNIQLNSEVPNTEKSLKQKEKNLISSSQQSERKEFQISDTKVKNTIKKNIAIGKNFTKIDSEEDELEFLLSLKEPVYSGPIIVKSIENERKLTVSSNNCADQKPVRSIDLEKWLDSVLDN